MEAGEFWLSDGAFGFCVAGVASGIGPSLEGLFGCVSWASVEPIALNRLAINARTVGRLLGSRTALGMGPELTRNPFPWLLTDGGLVEGAMLGGHVVAGRVALGSALSVGTMPGVGSAVTP